MQTLIKRHLIGLFALVLTVATMSFKMVENQNLLTGQWYPVNSGTIDSNGDSNPPGECDGFIHTCALQIVMLDESAPFPSTVTEAEALQAEEKLVINGRRWKNN